jgi:NAD(P)-dependent dehydrogenase (short-subunit alcohol dehydrogenase family)
MAHKAIAFAPGLLAGQVWLITGGGTGIGLGIAKDVIALGARVAIAGRREQVLKEAVEVLGADKARYFVCDIRREETVEALVQGVMSAFGGKIDVLVNNAGGQYLTSAENCKPKVLRQKLDGVCSPSPTRASRLLFATTCLALGW